MNRTINIAQTDTASLLPPTLQTIPAAIGKNIAIARSRSRARIMAVVKADGYGHGATTVALSLTPCAGPGLCPGASRIHDVQGGARGALRVHDGGGSGPAVEVPGVGYQHLVAQVLARCWPGSQVSRTARWSAGVGTGPGGVT
ncbi:alanine racemase [Pseudonocardia sp. H11422]|uniref:alanine racemase n=1 Tax=Pseudonocardia sp. H11422 TaxID=2835866 RepID=UPI0027E37A7D|nr:alanine racemase [Pseudonocardia sp. H11422]